MYALEIRNISKIFRIYPKPVDRLKEILFRRSFHQEFIALKEISFSVPIGQTVGIIGDNGVGKSTLLKILAGTLTPTSGEIIKRGRVAALLELGAGFHPEFTGRQNIYLNAALLGLSQQEIRGREKDIIDFAELREFIDRPVKTYSSGMYVRLAFSIATTVDPDILIVDEALSVGDQHFQKKCVDRMMGFRKRGKTIAFCSHSMYHINELCESVIWLNGGTIRHAGKARSVISAYEEWCHNREKESETRCLQTHPEQAPAWIETVTIADRHGEQIDSVSVGEELQVIFKIRTAKKLKVHIGAGFRNFNGDNLFGVTTKADSFSPLEINDNRTVSMNFPNLPLLFGKYAAFCTLLDETGMHVYDLKLSEEFKVEGGHGVYGTFFMEHLWNF